MADAGSEGTGLGLPLAKAMIELHGGSLTRGKPSQSRHRASPCTFPPGPGGLSAKDQKAA